MSNGRIATMTWSINTELTEEPYFRARGRNFTKSDIALISNIVRYNHELGRTKISELVCQALKWQQPNGRLKDIACREALRYLEAAGYISLPPQKTKGAVWKKNIYINNEAGSLKKIRRLSFSNIEAKKINNQKEKNLWNELVEKYHYLHSSRLVGRQIKYIFYYDGKPIACMGWGDAAWRIKARDHWIGWNEVDINKNLKLIINNVRFLILPWVKVQNLASHLLAKCANNVANDWQYKYGIKPVLLETFVDTTKYHGTCYLAANWIDIGKTSGYAKVGAGHHNSQTIKTVFVCPLNKRFRHNLKSL